jgi:hypothetical protein
VELESAIEQAAVAGHDGLAARVRVSLAAVLDTTAAGVWPSEPRSHNWLVDSKTPSRGGDRPWRRSERWATRSAKRWL